MSDDAFRTLWYLIENDPPNVSSVEIANTKNVRALKQAIILEEKSELAASSLVLWKVWTFLGQS
jgi:hypothetical protein